MARHELTNLVVAKGQISEKVHRTFPTFPALMYVMLDGELQDYEYNRAAADEQSYQSYELRVMETSETQSSRYMAFLKMGSLARLTLDDHLELEFYDGSTWRATIVHGVRFTPSGHTTLIIRPSRLNAQGSPSGTCTSRPFAEVVGSPKTFEDDKTRRRVLTKSKPTLVNILPSESTKAFERILDSFIHMQRRLDKKSPQKSHAEKVVDSLLLHNIHDITSRSIFGTVANQHSLREYFQKQNLDDTQMKAVEGLFDQKGVIGLIQGPPGTGKTFLILRIMGAFVKFPKFTQDLPAGPRRHQVMIISTTNALTSALARKSHEFLQTEMPQCKAVVTRVHALHTEANLFDDEVYASALFSDTELTTGANLKPLSSMLGDLNLIGSKAYGNRKFTTQEHHGIVDSRLEDIELSLAMRMLQLAGIVESDIMEHGSFGRLRELLKKRRRNEGALEGELRELERGLDELRATALRKSPVIVLTLSQAADPVVTKTYRPDHIFVDEASKPREPELMAVLAWYNCPITMVGDHLQTPPIVKSMFENSRRKQLELSHFERAVGAGLPYTMLTTQHRADPAISKITSDIWYDGSILNAPVVENRPDSRRAKEFNATCPEESSNVSIENDKPVRWINVTEAYEPENAGTSKFNPMHIKFVINRVVKMLQFGIRSTDIVILCFYEGQWKCYQQVLQAMEMRPDFEQYEIHKIQLVKTDGYQGLQGKHVVLEIPNTEKVGFLKEGRRLNTAISRAECSLTIVCNWDCLKSADEVTWLQKVYMKCEEEGLTRYIHDPVESEYVEDGMERSWEKKSGRWGGIAPVWDKTTRSQKPLPLIDTIWHSQCVSSSNATNGQSRVPWPRYEMRGHFLHTGTVQRRSVLTTLLSICC